MTSSARSVLLVHPDSHRRTALAEAFFGARVISASSREGVLRELGRGTPDLVLAHHGGARGLLRDLDRASLTSPRMLLGSLSDPLSVEALADMAAEGHQFFTLDDDLTPDALERQVEALLHGRRSGRARLTANFDAHFRASGLTFSLGCLEFGSRGLSVLVEPSAPVECLLPGTAVSDLAVRGPRGEILRAATGRVRNVLRTQEAGRAQFRVGIELTGEAAERRDERLADPIRVLATVRRALRRDEPLLLQFEHAPERQHHSRATSIRLRGGAPRDARLEFSDSAALGACVGDILRLSLELGGQSYSGLATVLAGGGGGGGGETPLVTTLPRTLTPLHRRAFLRLPSGALQGYGIAFRSAATGERVTYPASDLHPYGFSFQYEATREVLPPGLVFDELALVLPNGEEASCRGEVRALQTIASLSSGEATQRCGARITELSAKARDAIIDSHMEARHPSMENGARAPFADVWKVIRAAGHFYPDYPLSDGPHLEPLARTHAKLNDAGLSISRTLLHRDAGGEPVGHAAGLRVYSRTWLLHHLAAVPGYHRAEQLSRQLSSLSADHVEHLDDVDFVRLVWRAENRWPDRVFGSMARTMAPGGLSVVRRYHYARRAIAAPRAEDFRSTGWVTRRMRRADELWLEGHLRTSGQLLRLRADDLQADELELAQLNRRYAEHGLSRGRTGFVVDGDRGPLALALAEHATSGLSWPELTNAFTLFVPDPQHPSAEAARRALISRCVEHSAELGRPAAICLADAGDLPSLTASGFDATAGEVAEWTFHRQAGRTWHDLLQLIFERLARPARTRSAEGSRTE